MNPIQTLRWVALATLILPLSSCATIFGSSSDEVRLDSEPEGANVYFRDENLGKTPLTVNLPRRSEATFLTFKKDGFEPKTVQLGKSIAGAAFFNIGFVTTTCGATSWGIDAATGKLFKYNPRAYVTELNKPGATPATTDSESDESQFLPSPLEYTVANYDRLKSDLSHGDGEHLRGLCMTYGLSGTSCKSFESRLASHSIELLQQPDSLAWYRVSNGLVRD